MRFESDTLHFLFSVLHTSFKNLARRFLSFGLDGNIAFAWLRTLSRTHLQPSYISRQNDYFFCTKNYQTNTPLSKLP